MNEESDGDDRGARSREIASESQVFDRSKRWKATGDRRHREESLPARLTTGSVVQLNDY